MQTKSVLAMAAATLFGGIPEIVQAQPQLTVSTSAASGGPTAATLAQTLMDAGSLYTNGNVSSIGPTDLRAIGTFTGGNIASGTSLQDSVDPNAVFTGGVGIASGVVLSTGFLSDSEPTAPPNVPQVLDVCVQGANNGFPINLVDTDGNDIPNHEGEASKVLQSTAFGDADFRAVHSNPSSTAR